MAYLGNLAIFAAFAASLTSLVLYLLYWRGNESLRDLARYFFIGSAASITAAIAILLVLFLNHDFSVAYVFSYSSTDLPLGYLISSLWGGQEGTFLLWVFFASVLGLVMMYTADRFEAGNMFFLNLFLLSVLLILLKKSPFELMPVFRSEGAGLNPLLQNFWMQIHPPIMFVGFAAAVFPFCFAMTALVERKYHLWAESARRWTMFAWAALGVSLVMGGWWAYETLGWGGFWAWDPVENSSFIPWIFLTAQVHTLFIKRLRRGLMRFSIFVVSMSFWSVLYGTFLTRSGVLADFSVHSFVDLGINQYLVAGLFLFLMLGSSLMVYRWKDIRPEPSYSSVKSRSYLLMLGILVLFVGGVLVLLGTSAPLLTRLAENPSNVGIPYYFGTMTPIAIAVLLLIGMFPAFRWNNGLARNKLLYTGIGSGLGVALLLMLFQISFNPMYLSLFAAATYALISNSIVFWESYRKRPIVFGYLSHIGLAIALTGAAVSNGFEVKETINLPQGAHVQAMGYDLEFTHMIETPKGFDAIVEVASERDQFTAVLPHELPNNQEGVMRKPYIEYYPDHDLYVAPVALEQPKVANPGELLLRKGESETVGKYTVQFDEFEFVSAHGEEGGTTAAALVTVSYGYESIDLKPTMTVFAEKMSAEPVSFDDGAAAIEVAGLRPDDGAVLLKLSGESIPTAAGSELVLVIELSEKPLIILFWLGTVITFASGLLSMRERRRRQRSSGLTDETDIDRSQRVAAI
jgi:cytochrome c-type biogenesis protein CcmF